MVGLRRSVAMTREYQCTRYVPVILWFSGNLVKCVVKLQMAAHLSGQHQFLIVYTGVLHKRICKQG